MEYEEVGFSFIQNSIKSLLSQVDFDSRAFVKHPEFRKGVASFAIAAKAAAKAPFDLDDKGIDQLVIIIDSVIEKQKNTGPIEVGSTAELHEVGKAWRSRKEVEELIRAEGGDPTKFAPWVLIGLQFIQFLPQLIALIQQFLGSKEKKEDSVAVKIAVTVAVLIALLMGGSANASDLKVRGRAVWAWCYQAGEHTPIVAEKPTAEKPQVFKAAPSASEGSDDALDEVNAYRAKRGLTPFKHDALLTQAALACAKLRAASHIHGHLASDFDHLPPGAHADAAGCGALEDSWGWGTCCMDDNYSTAGAAWVRGSDGRRYMHLFVRNESSPAAQSKSTSVAPVQYSGETVCTSGSCGTSSSFSGRSVFRRRR